jgi:hypothetical protein
MAIYLSIYLCALRRHIQYGRNITRRSRISIYLGKDTINVPTRLNMTDILTKALPRETFVRFIAKALKPDDILPPIAQNEGEC